MAMYGMKKKSKMFKTLQNASKRSKPSSFIPKVVAVQKLGWYAI